MRISVLSYKDIDVYDGLDMLLEGHPNAMVVLPITGYNTFVKSALEAIQNRKAQYIIYITELTEDIEDIVNGAKETHMSISPNKDILRQLNNEEVVAFAWDDSEECHDILHSIEDFGCETWDIAEGLRPLDIDQKEVEEIEVMQEALSDFVSTIIDHVTANVLAIMEPMIFGIIRKAIEEEDEEE